MMCVSHKNVAKRLVDAGVCCVGFTKSQTFLGGENMEIFIWVLQGLLAAVFLLAGLGKLLGTTMHKTNFDKWQLPQWFRSVTGIVETVASIFLILGYWHDIYTTYGAMILIIVGMGGVFTHIRVKDSMRETFPITLLSILSIILLSLIV